MTSNIISSETPLDIIPEFLRKVDKHEEASFLSFSMIEIAFYQPADTG